MQEVWMGNVNWGVIPGEAGNWEARRNQPSRLRMSSKEVWHPGSQVKSFRNE